MKAPTTADRPIESRRQSDPLFELAVRAWRRHLIEQQANEEKAAS